MDYIPFPAGRRNDDGGPGRRDRWRREGGSGRGRGRGGGRGRGHGRGRRWGARGGQRRPRRFEDRTFNDVLEELGTPTSDSLTIAIQGCCHGALDAIYDRLQRHDNDASSNNKIDLLLCCGDFQSLRCEDDYHSLAVPPKYRAMGDFYKYYSGEKVAPYLTIFIGGNHEASQPLSELPYGGWVAPNIYYMGYAGVVQVRGVRIGGISGIYKSHDYHKRRFEVAPFDRSTVRSIYHVRNLDVYRMSCLSSKSSSSRSKPLDIMLSHDWPLGVEQYGDTADLLRRKPFFRDEVQRNDLGSPPNRELLDKLKPKWWFSAHLHVKFHATVQHDREGTESTSAENKTVGPTDSSTEQLLIPSQVAKAPATVSTESAVADNSNTQSSSSPPSTCNETKDGPSATATSSTVTNVHSVESQKCTEGQPNLTDLMTKFLSLDKCLPRREHLSILHIPISSTTSSDGSSVHDPDETQEQPLQLHYDLEWLAIVQKTHELMADCNQQRVTPPSNLVQVTTEDMERIREQLSSAVAAANEITSNTGTTTATIIPTDHFVRTVPAFDPRVSREGGGRHRLAPPLPRMGNPQTDALLRVLGLEHNILTIPYGGTATSSVAAHDDNQIELDDDDEDEVEAPVARTSHDPDEIDLDDDDDDEEEAVEEQPRNLNEIKVHEDDGTTDAGQDCVVATDGHQTSKKPRLDDSVN